MKRPVIKTNDIVHVTFLDHCENGDDAMLFEVYGIVTKITRKAYVIYTWRYADPIKQAADSNRDENEHCFVIVKSAIEEIRKLR